jgi:hypothetical protein
LNVEIGPMRLELLRALVPLQPPLLCSSIRPTRLPRPNREPRRRLPVLSGYSSTGRDFFKPRVRRVLCTLAPGHHRPRHPRHLVGERDGSDLGRPPCR